MITIAQDQVDGLPEFTVLSVEAGNPVSVSIPAVSATVLAVAKWCVAGESKATAGTPLHLARATQHSFAVARHGRRHWYARLGTDPQPLGPRRWRSRGSRTRTGTSEVRCSLLRQALHSATGCGRSAPTCMTLSPKPNARAAAWHSALEIQSRDDLTVLLTHW